jgi:tryptophan-rich hypothetical protein
MTLTECHSISVETRLVHARQGRPAGPQFLCFRQQERQRVLSRPSALRIVSSSDESNRSSTGSFAIPLKRRGPVDKPCFWCSGTNSTVCSTCGGIGNVPQITGQSRNVISLQHVINSKWTAMERTLGWRHFHCIQKMKIKTTTFVLLVATCDENAKLWVHIDMLKSKSLWAPGWLQKSELHALLSEKNACNVCETCQGTGAVQCRYCHSNTPIQLF